MLQNFKSGKNIRGLIAHSLISTIYCLVAEKGIDLTTAMLLLNKHLNRNANKLHSLLHSTRKGNFASGVGPDFECRVEMGGKSIEAKHV